MRSRAEAYQGKPDFKLSGIFIATGMHAVRLRAHVCMDLQGIRLWDPARHTARVCMLLLGLPAFSKCGSKEEGELWDAVAPSRVPYHDGDGD